MHRQVDFIGEKCKARQRSLRSRKFHVHSQLADGLRKRCRAVLCNRGQRMSFSLMSSGRPSLGGRSLAMAIKQPEVYSFPILTEKELADVLREMGAAVTEEDFNKPKAESFRTWCELFVIEILGISKHELYVANPDFVHELNGDDDLHEASVPNVHFIRNM